jgi:DNA polymerase III subunit delta'
MPFRALIGHRPALALLSRAVGAGTLPPSLIFAGPEGVGKRTAAIAAAQALNCRTPAAPGEHLPYDACGECATCRRIARGVHPDVTLIEPGDSGSIKIDTVREEIRKTAFKPFEGRRRVIVFDQAECLGADAQNALLKTLEEPPAGSVLILVTAQPNHLLPTVRSRCPVVRFAPLPPGDVAAWLIREHGVPDAQALAVAAVSRGSLSVARQTAEAGLEDVRAAAERALLVVAGARDPRARLDATSDIVGKGKGSGARERESLAAHLHALASLLRDLGALAAGSTAAVVNVDLAPSLARLAPAFDIERTLRAFAAIDRALGALDRNASPKIVADWVVLQI